MEKKKTKTEVTAYENGQKRTKPGASKDEPEEETLANENDDLQ